MKISESRDIELSPQIVGYGEGSTETAGKEAGVSYLTLEPSENFRLLLQGISLFEKPL